MKVNWHGVFPALTTQFHPDQSVDLNATSRHLDLLIRSGIHGVIALGSVGENTTMDRDEKLRVLQTAIETARGRIPVLSGVAECSTSQACRYARAAEELGADGFMVLPAM